MFSKPRKTVVDANASPELQRLEEQERQHFNQLRRLLGYVKYPFHTHAMLGRCTFDDTVIMYWPQITDLSSRHMRRDFYSDDVCAEECKALGLIAPDGQFIKRRLKETVEALLQPVLLSPYVRSSQQLIHMYAQKVEGITGLTREAGFYDPVGYTLFRRFNLCEKTHRRLFTRPIPKDTDLFADSLPPHFVCLQEMWEALSHRYESAFDSFDAGVEYLPSGLIGVNWLRYVRAVSQGLVPDVKARVIDARTIAVGFEADSRLLGGILAVRRDTPAFDKLFEYMLKKDMCTAEDAPFLSFFDPYHVYLGKHDRLFKGGWYFHRAEVRKQKRELYRKGMRERDPSRLPRALPLAFKPYDYIKEDIEKGLLPTPWFTKDYSEPIYTVKSRKEICFRRPALLSEAASRCPPEAEVWKRTLDAFHLIESMDPTDPAAVTKLNLAELKSEFLKRARLEFLDKAARSIIQDYRGLDTLRRKEMKAVKKKAQQTFVREQAEANTTNKRWYHDGVLKEVQDAPSVVDLRAQVTVRYPDDPTPRQEVFFRPSAIRMFARFATPPTPSSDKGTEPVRDAIDNAWRPAPYVLAWARFCLQVVTKVHLYGTELKLIDETDPTTQWIPQEDIALLLTYRNYPVLTREEWRDLLTKLHDRTQAMAYTRVMTLRKVLKRVLRPTSLKRLWPGSIFGDDSKARQVMFIYGAAQKLKIRKVEEHPLIGQLLRLTPERLTFFTIPSVYSLAYFSNLKP